MKLPSTRAISLSVATLVGVVAMACATDEPPVAPAPPAEPTPATISTQTSDSLIPQTRTPEESPGYRPAPEPVAAVAASEYDSNRVMYEVFPGFSLTSARMNNALEQIRVNGDRSLVPVLVEIIRFMPSANSRERIGDVLRDVTGQSIPSDDWTGWMEWLGRNLDSYQPPSEYAAWKASMMQALDARFALFLRPAKEFSRINLTEVVWGGVLPDGIPDLRNPPMLTPEEAEYLNEDDRVFGVTINGESRAYPLRIVNAHEMVNDTVGGEPISLMW